MLAPEDVNHASIRLDGPPNGTRLPVDENGKIALSGALHKEASMVDVSIESLTTAQFTFGPPPEGVTNWAASWTTTVRPPHLGSSQVCVRAEREPRRYAKILRTVTVVDLIPPSAVPGLAVTARTSNSAKVTWGAATDNYGLAGYEVTVDGGSPVRTLVGARSYSITGLSPSTDHSVSVVAIDLAGNRSTTPATVSFTTLAPPPPPDTATGLSIDAQDGYATVSWHPDPATDVTYKAFLDSAPWAEFPLARYCQDANGNPASPCTAQSVVKYEINDLAEGDPYALRIEAFGADGTLSRELSGTFTTLTNPPLVPEATVALIGSESSQCAARGGSVYVSPSQRGRVPIPAGSTELFTGCYLVPDHSCIDKYLPVSGDKKVDCSDDVTRLVFSVAPAGHGPVISSMDGIGASTTPLAVDPTDLLVETVTWCHEDLLCTVVIEGAVEVAAMSAASASAAAGISWLLVIGGGLLLGITLLALYEILFPSPIGIAGLIEYPIHPDTDFDTFDNWGLSKGRWINSLKTYAQVIKTTKLLAGQKNLPFAWDNKNDHDLKTAIDLACGAVAGRPPNVGNVCPENLVVYVPGGKNYKGRGMKETGTHIADALGNGIPNPSTRSAWFYPAYSKNGAAATGKGFPHTWYDLARFRPNACDTGVVGDGLTCDEFPFFSTNQAVNLTLPDESLVASVKLVPGAEGPAQGSDLARFYDQCLDNTSGKRFVVLPVKSWVEAEGPSFGFEVNQGGTSLCLPPT
ncbi:fibronectin type III domain-containing protein [Micromonospora sp. NPDC005298]|uniref:fibronectin type III domain-containing protein n=1 Tax=Micromonospora sp. NPDC005298 TaxID=3156873 RepID=UPI0033AED018